MTTAPKHNSDNNSYDNRGAVIIGAGMMAYKLNETTAIAGQFSYSYNRGSYDESSIIYESNRALWNISFSKRILTKNDSAFYDLGLVIGSVEDKIVDEMNSSTDDITPNHLRGQFVYRNDSDMAVGILLEGHYFSERIYTDRETRRIWWGLNGFIKDKYKLADDINLLFGLSYSTNGSQYTWTEYNNGNDMTDSSSMEHRLHSGVGLQLFDEKLQMAIQFGLTRLVELSGYDIGIGAEYQIAEWMALRAGLYEAYNSFGFGIKFASQMTLDGRVTFIDDYEFYSSEIGIKVAL